MSPRTVLGEKAAAVNTLTDIAGRYPELADELDPIAAFLLLEIRVIELDHAVQEHGSLELAALNQDPRVMTR